MTMTMRRIGSGESAVGHVKVMTLSVDGREGRVKTLQIEPGYILIEHLVRRPKAEGSGKVGSEYEDFVSLPDGGCKREWMSHDRFAASTREVSELR